MAKGLRAEGKAVGDLLRFTSRITIPIYQRDYNWGPDNIDGLWESIVNEIAVPASQRSLFLGALVFNEEKSSGGVDSDLVDGQQRISTISLLLGALRAKLQECQSNEAGRIQGRLEDMLFDRHTPCREPWEDNPEGWAIRLRPSKKDQANFGRMIGHGRTADKRTRMASAWLQLHNKIDDHMKDSMSGDFDDSSSEWDAEREKELTRFAAEVVHLLEGFTSFAVIEVSEPHNPFAVFESLNSTGLELAQSDLIKNFLLKQLDSERKREKAVADWQEFVDVVPQGQLVAFLRHWYIARFQRIPQTAVYKNYRERLRTEGEIESSLADWTRQAFWYSAFISGQLREDQPELQGCKVLPELHSWLDRYHRIGFKQGLPVLLAFIEGCDPQDRIHQTNLCEAMKLLETAYVRLFVTRQIRGSAFEAELNRLCREARAGPENGLAELRATIKELSEEHGAADQLDWTTLSLSVPRARWILYRIAEYQVGEGLRLGPPSQWHVEHILPQARNEVDFPKMENDHYDKIVGRVGNLTLLLHTDNQNLRNATFGEKRLTYATYDGSQQGSMVESIDITPRPKFPMNLDLAQKEAWDEVAIEARGRHLGRLANELWPVPAGGIPVPLSPKADRALMRTQNV